MSIENIAEKDKLNSTIQLEESIAGYNQHEVNKIKISRLVQNNGLSHWQQDRLQANTILCGKKVDGQVAISGSADTKGNKSAGVEVGIKSKDDKVSGSVSGTISQDEKGGKKGEAKLGVTVNF